MAISEEVIRKIADDTGISVIDSPASGLIALLRDKKRSIMVDRLEILDRYGVSSHDDLEKKIENSEVAEHPGWEDLIFLENIEAALAAIDEDIKSIQTSS